MYPENRPWRRTSHLSLFWSSGIGGYKEVPWLSSGGCEHHIPVLCSHPCSLCSRTSLYSHCTARWLCHLIQIQWVLFNTKIYFHSKHVNKMKCNIRNQLTALTIKFINQGSLWKCHIWTINFINIQAENNKTIAFLSNKCVMLAAYFSRRDGEYSHPPACLLVLKLCKPCISSKTTSVLILFLFPYGLHLPSSLDLCAFRLINTCTWIQEAPLSETKASCLRRKGSTEFPDF